MTRKRWWDVAVYASAALLLLVEALVGGTLLFGATDAFLRGIGVALLLLIPWTLTELLKERPTPPRHPRRK